MTTPQTPQTPRLDELKARLATLDGLIHDGTLTGDAARQARESLEAQVLAAVLQPSGGPAMAPPAAPPAARPSARLLAGVAAFVLVLGGGLYAWVGQPSALGVAPGAAPAAEAAHGDDPARFETLAERLAQRLKTQPDDAEGWAMLGRSYSVLGRPADAVQAYQRVLALRPDDAQALADLADAVASTHGGLLAGEPEALVQRALKADPDHPKALALAGTLALERGDPALAARHWARALAGVDPGSATARQLRGALDEARQRAGLPALPPLAAAAVPAEATPPTPSAAGSATTPAGAVQLRVTLAPALAARAAPQDTVFIFARAVQGPKAPLAIQRRQVKDLPLDLTLDDSMAMSPALRLSGAGQVVLGARISKSGNPMPQPGDLQGLSAPVPVGSRGQALVITEVLQ